ncbi:MAG: LysR family transcriptional regulator [Paracoccaceae bacterium]
MLWKIDDVPIFVAVVDQNGITAAASWLGMPKSTVSKSISRLEDALGVRLLERNSRNIRVTTEGERFYRQCQNILEEVHEADALMEGLQMVPSGKLLAALPSAFCQEFVAPSLGKFRREYPLVDLELTVTSRTIDLLRDQIDIAVVVGEQEDSELISRTLLTGRLIWVASAEYVDSGGLGESLDDLVSNIQICEKRYATRRFQVRIDGQIAFVDMSKNITPIDDPISVRTAVIHGAGVSFLPEQYCREQLKSGDLVEVYKHIRMDASTSRLSVVYPSRRLLAGRTRAFLEFLNEIC